MIALFLAMVSADVCPVDKPVECCLICQAKYLGCKDKSDSLSEEMECLRQKVNCQQGCSSKKK